MQGTDLHHPFREGHGQGVKDHKQAQYQCEQPGNPHSCAEGALVGGLPNDRAAVDLQGIYLGQARFQRLHIGPVRPFRPIRRAHLLPIKQAAALLKVHHTNLARGGTPKPRARQNPHHREGLSNGIVEHRLGHCHQFSVLAHLAPKPRQARQPNRISKPCPQGFRQGSAQENLVRRFPSQSVASLDMRQAKAIEVLGLVGHQSNAQPALSATQVLHAASLRRFLEALDRQAEPFHLAQFFNRADAFLGAQHQVGHRVVRLAATRALDRIEIQHQHPSGDGDPQGDAQDRKECATRPNPKATACQMRCETQA